MLTTPNPQDEGKGLRAVRALLLTHPNPNPTHQSISPTHSFPGPEEEILKQVKIRPLSADTFQLFNIATPESRDADDSLFAPIEISWGDMGGKREGIGVGMKHTAAAGRGSPSATSVPDRSPLRVRGFIDCGASHGIVSGAFVTQHNIRTIADSSLGSCLLGDGSARVDHVGRTELVRVRCGDANFLYSFHILRHAAYDLILGRDVMRKCGMVIQNVPTVFPSDVDADAPRRAEEQRLLDRRRLTGEGSRLSALPGYAAAVALCQAAVARNEKARISSGGRATTLPNSQLRIRHEPDTPPTYTVPYNIKHTDRVFVDSELSEWLLWFQIELVPRSSHSSYNTPLLVAYTYGSDGTIKKRRLCGDFRGLNKKLLIEEFGLPLIRDILASLSCESVFSEIDLRQAYLQFDVHPEDRFKLRFRHDGKTYQFCRGSFGIASLSDHCQRHISLLFSDIPEVRVYMDNILLATGGLGQGDDMVLEAHANTIVRMLDRMTEYFLWVRPEKCHFLKDSIRTLGHVVSRDGVQLDPEKVTQVQAWPVPTTYNQLRAFLGFVAFLRTHIRHATVLCAPLNAIKDPGKSSKAPLTLTQSQLIAFETLKIAISKTPTLRCPDFDRPFVVGVDASVKGIGGVLFQPLIAGGPPTAENTVAFTSRSLCTHEYAYSAYKLECLGLVYCLREWDDYLHGVKFVVETDHRALMFLFDNSNRIVANWLQIVLDYRFDVIHIPGVTNVAPDHLSRIYEEHKWGEGRGAHLFSTAEAPIRSLSVNSMTIGGGQADVVHTATCPELIGDPFTCITDPPLMLFAIAAPIVTPARRDLIMLTHEKGHFGVAATYERLRSEGHNWPGMRLHVLDAIHACPVCRAWTANKARFGPLNSLLTRIPMEHVQFDLLSSFDPSGGFTYLMVLVDLFTGFTWLRPIPNKDTHTLSSILWDVFKDFGWPRVVQSDGDATNITAVLRTMVAEHGAEHRSITAYNPRAIGKVESRGGAAALCIRKLLAQRGGEDWHVVAPIAQHFLNTKHDTVLQATPFSLMFNRDPHGFADYVMDVDRDPTPAELEQWKTRLVYARELANPMFEQRIEMARLRQAESVNATRPQAEQLEEGTVVMLKRKERVRGKNTSPFEPTPFTTHSTPERHRYELRDARSGKVRSTSVPIEHLKVLPKPTHITAEEAPERMWPVERILGDRKRKVDGVQRQEYQLRWLNFGPEHDSWEPITAIGDGSMVTRYHAEKANASLRARQARGGLR